MAEHTPFDLILHVIQSSLSPVFLLSAVSSLLSVFTTRLARVADQVKALAQLFQDETQEDQTFKHRLAHLKHRTHALDVAVILASVAGGCTCVTVLILFLGLISAKATASLLFILFGIAVLCTISALGAFLVEVLLASRGIRAEVADHIARLEQ